MCQQLLASYMGSGWSQMTSGEVGQVDSTCLLHPSTRLVQTYCSSASKNPREEVQTCF